MDDLSDFDAEPVYAASSDTPSRPTWLLFASLAVSIAAIAAFLLGTATVSVAAYALALVGGTGLLAAYRLMDGRASKSSNYVSSGGMRKLAVLAGVLVVVACATNAFVFATEMAKQ